MEKSKKASSTKCNKEERNVIGGCPWWIFGNKKSSDKDLKEKFEVIDEEDKSNK